MQQNNTFTLTRLACIALCISLSACDAKTSHRSDDNNKSSNNADKATVEIIKIIESDPSTLPTIIRRAESGDVSAAKALGFVYFQGKKVKKDTGEGLRYLKIAADAGDKNSICFISKFLTKNQQTASSPDTKLWESRCEKAKSDEPSKRSPSPPMARDLPWPDFERPPTPIKGYGSSVAINEDGFFITNRHVIENCDHVVVRYNKKFAHATVNRPLNRNDIALIKVNAKTPYFVNFAPTMAPLGEKIYAGGYPIVDTPHEGLKITDGLVSGLDNIQDGILQVSAQISSGSSGGPIVDQYGRLVGIARSVRGGIKTKSGDTIGTGITFGIHSEYAKFFLNALDTKYTVEKTQVVHDGKTIAQLLTATTGLIICH